MTDHLRPRLTELPDGSLLLTRWTSLIDFTQTKEIPDDVYEKYLILRMVDVWGYVRGVGGRTTRECYILEE